MELYGEYFGRGHPDRLCDEIVDILAEECLTEHPNKYNRYTYNLNCRINKENVYVYGHIIGTHKLNIFNYDKAERLIKFLLIDLRFGKINLGNNQQETFHPLPENLKIHFDINYRKSDYKRDKFSLIEKAFSTIGIGYACGSSKNGYLPLAQFLALIIGVRVDQLIQENKFFNFNYRLEVILKKEGKKYTWDSLILNLKHSSKISKRDVYNYFKTSLVEFINALDIKNLESFDCAKIRLVNEINEEDEDYNLFFGQSNQRLAFDYYGPQIPHPDTPIHGRYLEDTGLSVAHRGDAINMLRYRKGYSEVYITTIHRQVKKMDYYHSNESAFPIYAGIENDGRRVRLLKEDKYGIRPCEYYLHYDKEKTPIISGNTMLDIIAGRDFRYIDCFKKDMKKYFDFDKRVQEKTQ